MSFQLVPKSVTLNDLNGVMVVILRYFTKLVYNVVLKKLAPFHNLLLIVDDRIKMICSIIQQLFGQNKL